MTILDEIIAAKRHEVSERRDNRPVRDLEKSPLFERQVQSMANGILFGNKTGIIAEFKRKSPSRGVINDRVSLEEVTTGYFRSGAAGLSVLTDYPFFGGSDEDLLRARELNPIPILRKDFILDEYQVIETRALGADAMLLIAAALTPQNTSQLARLARSIGLEVLLEIHEERELDHLNADIALIGVNNRNLKDFVVDIEISLQLVSVIPPDYVKISESGIASPLVYRKLKNAGFQGFLIGENFMRTPDPVTAFSDFIQLIIEK